MVKHFSRKAATLDENRVVMESPALSTNIRRSLDLNNVILTRKKDYGKIKNTLTTERVKHTMNSRKKGVEW